MKNILIDLWNFLFNYKTICGKTQIEKEMTEKYGADWLEQCMESLRNPEIREQLRKDLNLHNRG